jgi:GNAT superfamily N-acetyltransferase
LRTIYLGREEVDAYARDFAIRLVALSAGFPTVWCPIGKSGDHLARLVAQHLPDDAKEQVQVVPVIYNKTIRTASLEDEADRAVIATAATILVLDSSVHSGGSMLAVMRLLSKMGASLLISYTLVIKRGAKFVPHYFGVVVGDHDRVLFLLKEIPNNRLFTGKNPPLGFFRRIEAEDIKRPQTSLDTGVVSLDKISWGDLFYEYRANGYDVIVVEDRDAIAGFLKLKIKPGNILSIDVIANDKSYQGKGIGGALMRYAETIGRAHESRFVELWAISNQVEFYKRYGFDKTEEVIDTGAGEIYVLMRRALLYQFDLDAHTHRA